jgi:hypothetical protein
MSNPLFWKSVIDNKIKNKEKHNLIFIHTPKCGGSFANSILKDLHIINKGHNQAVKNEGINCTIIRDPVERFESLLNYRLSENKARSDWPKHLQYVYNDKSISLNEIVSKMTDEEILNFKPYNNLVFWSKNIDIFITIEQLHEFLHFFGYNYDKNSYNKKNISNKIRGKLNKEMCLRISKLYNDDVVLFKNVIK